MAEAAAAAAPAAAPPAPAPAPAADWRTGIPEDLRGAPALKDVKDVGSLAKSYLEAQSALGSSVRLPSKDAGEDGRKAFRSRMLEVGKDYGVVPLPAENDDEAALHAFYETLGRPKDAAEYALPDAQAEGLTVDMTEAELFKGIAHKAGLTAKQFKRVVTDMAKAREEPARAARDAFNVGHEKLKAEWLQDYDSRVATTAKLLELHKAPEGLRAALKANRVDAETMRWLHAVTTALGADPVEMQSQGKGNAGRLTKDEAMARVAEIEARLAKLNQGDPDYDALVKRRVDLIELAG